ncbi:MAG: isoprenylcysteine carboxylmethyltransferase family protein [Chloroflexi bacterium]|nr:isoprenylcysteine carboxylmethyltransferase family protein [Chloroflexota bacterium]
METESIFRVLLPLLIIAFALHRGYYVKNHSKSEDATLKKREEGLASKLAGLLGMVGFVSIILFAVNPNWLAVASLSLPLWARWAGVGMALIGFTLLQWAQVTLGKSWSDQPRMMKEQTLITSGPYRTIRHPIYTAFLLILGSTLFISSNWLIGLSWAGMTLLEVASRIRFEESLMIEYFGDQYREYMKRTGRLLPRINIVTTSVVKPGGD